MRFTNTQKVFISLWFIGVILWIGGSVVQTTLAYDLFQPKKILTLKTFFNESDALINIRNFTVGSVYIQIGFLLAFLSAIVLFPTLKANFRTRGWLLMSYILFTISSIFGLILLYFDIRLSLYIFYGSSNLSYQAYEVQKFFVWRLQNISFMILYNWFAIISIIFLIVFGPLTEIQCEN